MKGVAGNVKLFRSRWPYICDRLVSTLVLYLTYVWYGPFLRTMSLGQESLMQVAEFNSVTDMVVVFIAIIYGLIHHTGWPHTSDWVRGHEYYLYTTLGIKMPSVWLNCFLWKYAWYDDGDVRVVSHSKHAGCWFVSGPFASQVKEKNCPPFCWISVLTDE